MMTKRTMTALLFALFALLVLPVGAQDTTVTADEVNEIAAKMYCPVCENIPLDSCGTAACQDWQNEIRLYLEDGWSEEQIISDFVARFGDRVVGTPRDPVVRAMALWTPWVLAGLAFIVAMATIFRGRNPTQPPASSGGAAPDELHAQLEQDLNG